jgi:hypothetical protein
VVGASSPKSLARSCCPKKPSLAGSTLQCISIDVLSRLDPGITRWRPDLAEFSRALLFLLLARGAAVAGRQAPLVRPPTFFSVLHIASCVCVMHAGTTRHTRHTELIARRGWQDKFIFSAHTQVFYVSVSKF